jgi:predicted GIY-YIG superfamily endonuclease
MGALMACYLLHFDRPYPAGRRPQHYLGYARNVAARVAQHASGTSGAKLPTVMHAAGIGFTVARVWPAGDVRLERRLHRWNKSRVLCPVCRSRSLPTL